MYMTSANLLEKRLPFTLIRLLFLGVSVACATKTLQHFPRGSAQSNGAQYYIEHSIVFHGNFVRLSIHYFNLAHNISLWFPIMQFSFIEKLKRLTICEWILQNSVANKIYKFSIWWYATNINNHEPNVQQRNSRVVTKNGVSCWCGHLNCH